MGYPYPIHNLINVEITIKLTENISDSFWIHETQSAINHEFKIRSIQASSVHPASRGAWLRYASTNPQKNVTMIFKVGWTNLQLPAIVGLPWPIYI